MLQSIIACAVLILVVGGGATAFIVWNTGTLQKLNKILKSKDLK